MHPSEYTVAEVQFFLMAIGLEAYCEVFEEKQINGQIMISMTKVELEKECGMTSVEIKKFTAAIEFSFEVAEGSKDPDTPTCKPPKKWTEAEVCVILVAIGLGHKVEEVKKCQVTGAMVVSMTKVEIEKECGMTSIEVQRFQAVIVKSEGGGCGINPEMDTYPITEEGNKGPNKAAIGIAVGGAIVAGGVGYWAWKKHQNNKQEEEVSTMPITDEELQKEEESAGGSGGGGSCEGEKPPLKHPCDWTQIEVKYFLIAIGLESKCPVFEENAIDGQMLIKLTKTELEVDLGCSSIQIRKFTVALEFSIEVSEGCQQPEPPCKPPQDWSEVEVCVILVMIGFGQKVKEFKKHQITGAMAVSMTKVELQQECGMTSIEVKKFKAVAVKY